MPPTGVKSNMVNAVPVSSLRRPDTTMLGEVPIWVISPPSSEPNAIGIRKTEGEAPDRRANWKAIGIMIASAPMFFTKADMMVTTMTSSINWARTEEILGAKRWMANSMMPERATPALTRNAQATMMTMSLEKPLNASSNGTIPTATRQQQRPARHQIVTEPAPDEEHHHQAR